MTKWLECLGHSGKDLNDLNVIHVAGTNGKGSTCIFTEALLLAHARSTGFPAKIGVYTSPHLHTVRERIRINGSQISEAMFAKYFFEAWDVLPKEASPELDYPRYLQLLALVSFRVFIREKVDVAIYEAHMGGRYDATNVVERPVLALLTEISLDHCKLLGDRIEDIAWHKSGILKHGSLALSTVQSEPVKQVIRRQAADLGVSIDFIGVDTTVSKDIIRNSLACGHQDKNASLAIAAARVWLKEKRGQDLETSTVKEGLHHFSFPGRFQRINDGSCTWYLDGAHNESGLKHAAEWFSDAILAGSVPVLVFAHFSTRDSLHLLRILMASLKCRVRFAIFTSYAEQETGKKRPGMSWRNRDALDLRSSDMVLAVEKNLTNSFSQPQQDAQMTEWRRLGPGCNVEAVRSIESALQRVRAIARTVGPVAALVTGSLHLVGGADYLLHDSSQAMQGGQ